MKSPEQRRKEIGQLLNTPDNIAPTATPTLTADWKRVADSIQPLAGGYMIALVPASMTGQEGIIPLARIVPSRIELRKSQKGKEMITVCEVGNNFALEPVGNIGDADLRLRLTLNAYPHTNGQHTEQTNRVSIFA